MEELREGIYLRGYGQQDPLVAYKNEAHTFFDQMKARIATGVAQTILRVNVKTAEQAEAEEREKLANEKRAADLRRTEGPDAGRNLRSQPGSPATPNRLGPAPASPAKLGRNDPCYCGSGKKYKKCHGR
jgi:preprotein translocase subunit SecA